MGRKGASLFQHQRGAKGKSKSKRTPNFFNHKKVTGASGHSIHLVTEKKHFSTQKLEQHVKKQLIKKWNDDEEYANQLMQNQALLDEALFDDENDEDPDVKPQEYLNYLNDYIRRYTVREFKKYGGDILQKIDQISKDLVAQFKADELFRVLKKTPMCKCTRRGVRMIINHRDPNLEEHGTTIVSSKVQTEAAIKKGVNPDVSKPPTSLVSAAVRELGRVSGLFGGSQGKDYQIHSATAGAFFVTKSNGLLRIIIDGRLSNTFFDGAQGKFSLFTIETVRQVLDNLSVTPDGQEPATWYALNLDLRHWFHQLSLPIRLQNFFHIEMTDRNNRNNEEKYYMHPLAVPMGFTLAPFIAQCCTWSLLLNPLGDGKENLSHCDLGEQKEIIEQRTEPPIWVPLKSGGGIFVLLDNILIATPKKEVADFWFNRLLTNCETFHAVIKHSGDEKLSGDQLYDQLRKECYHVMTPGSDKQFTFYGVEWQHARHRVPVKEDESIPLPEYNKRTRTFSSRRNLASVLGKLLWHRRIHRMKFYDQSPSSTAIMELYSRYTPKERSGWNEDFIITAAEERGLQEGWDHRLQRSWLKAQPLCQLKWSEEDIVWAAADAAGDPSQMAGVLLPRKSASKISNLQYWTGLHSHAEQIALAEFKTIIFTVKKILEESQDREPKVIVLATDSQNAKNWIEKGHAKNKTAMDYLRELDTVLGNCRLYLVYINTEDNVADQPSRNRAFVDSRLQETIKVLKMAESSAKGLWRVSGGVVGGEAVKKTVRRQRD